MAKVEYAQCKCQSKYLMQQFNQSSSVGQIDSGAPKKEEGNFKRVKMDNLYDILFQNNMKPKSQESLAQRVQVGSNGLINVLENSENFKLIQQGEDEEAVLDLSKVKINKQFKLVSSLPKLRSVPATP